MPEDLTVTLSDFVESMVTEASVEDILGRFTNRLVEMLPVTGAGITLIGSETAPAYMTASSPTAMAFEELQTQMLEGPCVAALETGAACAVPDLRSEARFTRYGPAAVRAGLGAVFAFPLRTHGTMLGAVDLYRELPGQLSADELSATQVLSDVVATFVVNARERRSREMAAEHLQSVATRDPLTHLANRVLLQERLEQAARRRARSERNFAVIFIDLDGFKAVNDRYGHGVGDELLVALAARLSAVLRPADTLARLGGDEFVIVCEELDTPEIGQLAARIAAQFERPFELASATVRLQASIGTALSGPGLESPEALLAAADAAMYDRKPAVTRLKPRGRAGRRASPGLS